MTKGSKKSLKTSPIKKTSKEEQLFLNLLKTVQQFIEGKNYKPLPEIELFQRLHIAPQHLDLFHKILATLRDEGIIELSHGKYHVKKESVQQLCGLLRLNHRGFGFVELDDKTLFDQDIFIPKHLTMTAIDGDHVEIQVNPENFTEKGPEGKIISIVSRAKSHLAGIILNVKSNGSAVAYVPMLGPSQQVTVKSKKGMTFQAGDRIIIEIVDWGTKETETTGKMYRHLGHISDPSSDTTIAIEEFGIRHVFLPDVVEEAKAFGTKVSTKEIKNREDLRHLECFTIDPDTAKDFDDALSLSKDENGHYHLGVHIADVSHYVKPGSALDDEARLRCNSTYFPGNCVPMLPHELSNNLCSLKPNVNRLTVSILMHFNPHGEMLDYRVSRSVIKSRKRFTYKEAKEVLDGKKPSPYAPTLHLMTSFCKLLKLKRHERGSIEFSIPELVILVDPQGKPYGTDYVLYDVTHQLVEEFMLKANELVATHLSKAGKNLTYRVHDIPAEENMREFALLAGAFGFNLSDKPTPAEIQNLFEEALNTTYGPYLATSYIRRMRLATYSAENIGHYGLSLTHYCHFTSPIRRYVDLVSHRILFGEKDDRKDLEAIAQLSSEKERISAKAETSVIILKKLRLLLESSNKNPLKQYDAIVTRVKPFGFFFEVIDFMLEGFLHVSNLDNDYFIFDENKIELKGRHHNICYKAGDRITIMLKNADLIMQTSEWELVFEPVETTRNERKTKSDRRKKSGASTRKSGPKSKRSGKKK